MPDSQDVSPASPQTTQISDPQTLSQQPKASLYVLLRDGAVFEHDLTKPETRIGKAPQNDLVLADASVSATHAMLSHSGDQFALSDLGSRNGTFVNDARVTEPQALHHGDLIKIGHCTITFRLNEAADTLSMPRTMLLDLPEPPPPPAPPLVPKPAAITEDVLAAALVSSGLVAQSEIDRLRNDQTQTRGLIQGLLAENLITEIGLRDLIARTFSLTAVDPKTLEIDVATATTTGEQLLREHLIYPAVSQQSDRVLLAVADPTDKSGIEQVERKMRRKAVLRIAQPSEIAEQLDAFFLPRLIGLLPNGEKIEALLNQSEIEIGKAVHNRLVIDDPTVSATHAILLVRDGGYNIADLGSSNGTFINGVKLGNEAYTLQHGDKIQLGQVLLTFRNPAETNENKTARLSMDALEEARNRVVTRGMQSDPNAEADPDSWSAQVAPAAFISPQVEPKAEPDLVEEDDKEEKESKKERKERERLKKEGQRLKAAWVGGISRIVAQVIGVALTVVLTVYLLRPGGGGGGSGSTPHISSKGKMTGFNQSKSWESFSTGLFAEKLEASGVAQVNGSNSVLIVSDNRVSDIFWMQLDANGKQAGLLKTVPLGVNFKDPESITYGGGFYYLMCSQAHPQEGDANAIVRFDFNPETQTLRGPAEIIPNLRSFLLANVSALTSLGAPSGKEGGLNIEGIAWDPNYERLLLGLRSPQIGSQAVIVPLKLRDPRGPFKVENLKIDDPHVIVLSLNGQGIRDIIYDPRAKSFLIISGEPETMPKSAFGLWEWSGQPDAAPTQLSTLDDRYKPEGLAGVVINGSPFVFVVGDSGNYMKLDYAGEK